MVTRIDCRLLINKDRFNEFFPQSIRQDLQNLFSFFSTQNIFAACVGGSVRDLLLKGSFKDIDLAIQAPPDWQSLKSSFEIRQKFPYFVYEVRSPHNNYFEISVFREDIDTDGRQTSFRLTQDIEKDAQRRDFTINALYLTPDHQIIDFFSGIQDIQEKKLRFIGNPEQKIQEDHLRILRYLRFLSNLPHFQGMNTEEISKHISLVQNLSHARIYEEMVSILHGSENQRVLQFMEGINFFQYVGAPSFNFEKIPPRLWEKRKEIPPHLYAMAVLLLAVEKDNYGKLSPITKKDKKEMRQLSIALEEKKTTGTHPEPSPVTAIADILWECIHH